MKVYKNVYLCIKNNDEHRKGDLYFGNATFKSEDRAKTFKMKDNRCEKFIATVEIKTSCKQYKPNFEWN